MLPYLGLALTAFLAATILPFSSEAAVIAAVLAGWDPVLVLFWASLGNGLACLLNYGLGRLFSDWALRSLQKNRWGVRAQDWINRYGMVSMSLSWLPLIGDPLTIAAGLVRLNFWWFALIVVSLRIARYVAIIWVL